MVAADIDAMLAVMGDAKRRLGRRLRRPPAPRRHTKAVVDLADLMSVRP
jgi:hypothetical protein